MYLVVVLDQDDEYEDEFTVDSDEELLEAINNRPDLDEGCTYKISKV